MQTLTDFGLEKINNYSSNKLLHQAVRLKLERRMDYKSDNFEKYAFRVIAAIIKFSAAGILVAYMIKLSSSVQEASKKWTLPIRNSLESIYDRI